MEPPKREESYKYIILGTGLFQSTLALVLAARDIPVCVVDNNEYYGEVACSFSPEDFDAFLKGTPGVVLRNSYVKYPIADMRRSVRGSIMIDLVPSLCHSVSLEVQVIQASGLHSLFNLKRVSPVELIQEIVPKAKEGGERGEGGEAELNPSPPTTDPQPDPQPPTQTQMYKTISIPSSREALFNNKTFSIRERHQLMKLVNTFIEYFKTNAPFVFRTPPRDTSPAEMEEACRTLPNFPKGETLLEVLETLNCSAVAHVFAKIITARDERVGRREFFTLLARFISSANRYCPTDDSGFLVVSAYGNGELPQALSRFVSLRGSSFIFSKFVKEMCITADSVSLTASDGTLITAPVLLAPAKSAEGTMLDKPLHIAYMMFRGHPEPGISRLFAFGDVWMLLRVGSVVPRGHSCVTAWREISEGEGESESGEKSVREAIEAAKCIFGIAEEDVIMLYEYDVLSHGVVSNNTLDILGEHVPTKDERDKEGKSPLVEFVIPSGITSPFNPYDCVVEGVIQFARTLGINMDIEGSASAVDLATISGIANKLCNTSNKDTETIDNLDVDKILKDMEGETKGAGEDVGESK